MATSHEKIKVFAGGDLPYEEVMRRLGALRRACERRDLKEVVFELKDMIPDYNVSNELLHRLLDSDLSRLASALTTETVAPAVESWAAVKA